MAAVFLGMPGLRAQNGDSQVPNNEAQQTEETAAVDASQVGDAPVGEDEVSTNAVAETNAPVTPGPDGRTRRLQRQRRPRASSSNGSSGPAVTVTNNTRNPLDYSAFRLVADRNIFDPNRSPRSFRTQAQPRTVDSFTLVGTMSYEKGEFAFFDGSSSEYKKVLKTSDVIAGHIILAISPELVTLASGTNHIELRVGSQMRRHDDGRWERSSGPAAYAAASNSSNQSEAPSSGAESDTIKKMMMRREKE